MPGLKDIGGSLEKLQIKGYKDAEMKNAIDNSSYFTAQFNPSTISITYSTKLVGKKDPTDGEEEVKYTGANPPTMSFDIILDGTGAAQDITSPKPIDVLEMVESFKKECYYYEGDVHDIPYVQIIWGGEILTADQKGFAGRLEKLDIKYTLFSAKGKPLRATLAVAFKGTMDKESCFKSMGKSSPDLTHLITVKAGDSLPMLCEKIYKDSSKYYQVAKINKLTNFRNLIPGQQLEFPPIKKI